MASPHSDIDIRGRVRTFLGRAGLGTLLTYLLVAALVAGAVVVLGRDIAHHVRSLEAWVGARGAVGLVVFGVIFVVVTTVLFPESVLSMAAGALFGLTWGLTVVVVASLVAAVIQYGLARILVRRRIQRVIQNVPSLVAIQRATRHDEVRLQVLIRLTPLSPAAINYVMGAAGVRLGGFVLACFAFVPMLFVEVYFGYVGKHVAGMAGRPTSYALAHDVIVLVGIVACLVAMVMISRMAKKAIVEAVDAGAEHGGGTGA